MRLALVQKSLTICNASENGSRAAPSRRRRTPSRKLETPQEKFGRNQLVEPSEVIEPEDLSVVPEDDVDDDGIELPGAGVFDDPSTIFDTTLIESEESKTIEAEGGEEEEEEEDPYADPFKLVADPKLVPPDVEEEPEWKIRKTKALMDICKAGAEVEEAIARNYSEIDEQLLELLAGRREAATYLEQKQEVLDGLDALHRRLSQEVARKKASPSLRLLDKLIGILEDAEETILNPDPDAPPKSVQQKQMEAAAAVKLGLRNAFSGTPNLQGDVISIASQIAMGGERVVDELLDDLVVPDKFIQEVVGVLAKGHEGQAQLKAALDSWPKDQQGKDAYENLYANRGSALVKVEAILKLARAEATRSGRRLL